MNYRLQITMVALVITTIALAPSLLSSQLAQAQTTTKIIKCEDEKGKSHTWITGCKDGWYNWGVCGVGPEKCATGQYDQSSIIVGFFVIIVTTAPILWAQELYTQLQCGVL
jgi:hypothetical protein